MTDTAAIDRRDLFITRLYFFIWIGGMGFLQPFLGLFYRRQGLSGTQIGTLATVSSIAALISAPLWGRLSDISARPRRLIQIGLIGSALSLLLVGLQHNFIWMAVLIAAEGLIAGGVWPLSAALALGVARRVGYGSVRMWGSLGWAVIVVLAGWLIEQTGLLTGFVGYALLSTASALILFLISPGATRRGRSGMPEQPGLIRPIGTVFRNRTLLWLAIMMLAFMLAQYGVLNFETIYLDQLGASEATIGQISMISALAELPGMLWADRLVVRFGPRRMMLVVMLIRVAMMAAVLVIPRVETIAAIRAVGGVAFAFLAVAQLNFISDCVPAEHRTLALAVFNVTLPGLVGIMGGPLSGLAFDAFGAYWLYAIALGGYVLGWAILRFATTDRSQSSG